VEIAASRVRGALLIGEAAEKIGRALSGRVPYEIVPDLGAAVDRAAARASEGDVVLLSPACASFDQFQSFGDRGDRFRQAVASLEGRGPDTPEGRGPVTPEGRGPDTPAGPDDGDSRQETSS
jgi:UDP-N-acetylmuramoylalanine-D-glutamate ligase